jgi:hypothetical protein
MIDVANPMTMTEKDYLKWAGEKIVRLENQNATLLEALEATQDIARMVAFTSDVRLQLGPTARAVDYFNKMFPEVAKAIALAEGKE